MQNSLIIVNSTGHVSTMGVRDNCNFRGFIYVKCSYQYSQIYQVGDDSNIYGAIHHASDSKFNVNPGSADSLRLLFKDPLAQSAIQEICNTGIILAPGYTEPEFKPIVVDAKIRPTMISMQL